MTDDTVFKITEASFYFITILTVVYNLPILVSLLIFLPLCLKVYTRLTVGMCKSIKRLDGKTVIVTGANTGIGFETAKDMAKRGAKVILACRNMDKGKEALELIKRDTQNDKVFVKCLDLTSFSSVRKFASEIIVEEPRLDILINNAGVTMTTKVLTADKLETDFQSNHCSPSLLTILLLDLMKKTGNARIIMLSSHLHRLTRNYDFDNLNSEKDFKSWMAYSKTKVANILFAKELHRRLRAEGITDISVNAVHPGVVRTELHRHVNETFRMRAFAILHEQFMKNTVEGAQTSIHVAVSEDVDDISGEYFADCQTAWTTSLAKDPEIARNLWEHTMKLVKIKPEETILKSKST